MPKSAKLHSRLRMISASVILVSVAGCATITRGTTDTLVISSDPPNAEVTLSNGLRCRTRCSLAVKRNENLTVQIAREGYEPVEATVTPKVAGGGAAGMAGNVLLGGLIGAAVDAGSGAMYDLVPNPLHVNLVRVEEATPQTEEPETSARIMRPVAASEAAFDGDITGAADR